MCMDFLILFFSNFLTDCSLIMLDTVSEQATKRQLIVQYPSLLCMAAVELLAVWAVAPSCRKNVSLSLQ